MKKLTWIPLLIIIVGVCIALAGFAGGGGVKGIKGIAIDRGGIRIANTDLGELVKVDENYTGVKEIEISIDFLEKITLREGDGFSVRGQNYERFGGLKSEQIGDTLYVTAKQEGRWIGLGLSDLRRGWNRTDTWVEITFPKGTKLDNVRSDIAAGRLIITDLSASALLVSNDFGDVELSSIKANDVILNLSAGDAKVRDVSAEMLTVSNDFGKINLAGAVANTLTMNISAGDLSADNVDTRDLFVDSDFGSVKFDRLVLSGTGIINMSSGEVNIGLNMSEDDLGYDLSTSAGKVSVDGRTAGGIGGSISNRISGDANLRVASDFGAITLRFLK